MNANKTIKKYEQRSINEGETSNVRSPSPLHLRISKKNNAGKDNAKSSSISRPKNSSLKKRRMLNEVKECLNFSIECEYFFIL